MKNSKKISLPIAVTIGEPSGIGPEVILKAWDKRSENSLNPFFVIGSAIILKKQAENFGLNIPISIITSPHQALTLFKKSLPVFDFDCAVNFKFGHPKTETAPMVLGAIDKAVEFITNGSACAMVTSPIHKASLYGAGFKSPGHTEYLAALSKKYTGKNYQPVMMLASDELRVVPVTIHVALSKVPAILDQKLLKSTIQTVYESLKKNFDISFPRIAVAGLNPHAGEDNSMGTEDSNIIAPVIDIFKKKNIHIFGPMSADTMFHKSARSKYDVAICMYHDQALIPIKTIDFDAGVNVTLGLPIIRTSPDHGTAFDIAGHGLANPTSMINSLQLADRLSRTVSPTEKK